MVTGSLDFAPTRHNVTPERVAFVYNVNESDSLEVAEYYRDKRGLPNENLVGLSIPTPVQGTTGLDCEAAILDEADYLYQIEYPLLTALENLGTDNPQGGGSQATQGSDPGNIHTPEPTTVILMGSGLLWLAAWRWKKKGTTTE